ncbi:MAG TPA: hypothetical protein VGP64_14545 [Polyangia bacterium]
MFPAPDGKMFNKRTQLKLALRRAMRRANLVTGYVQKCPRTAAPARPRPPRMTWGLYGAHLRRDAR